MIRFSRLKLENWRNFTKVDIPLQDRAFIIGPNASGKSNLLDAFRFLRDIAKDKLETAVNMPSRGGMAKIRSLWARSNPVIAIECELLDTTKNVRWSYRLELQDDKRNGGRIPRIKKELVKMNGEILVDRPNLQDKEDPPLLSQTYLEQVSMNKKFRELAEGLKSVRYLHLVPQLFREQTRSKKIVDDPYGSDFLEHIFDTKTVLRQKRLDRIGRIIKIAVPQFEKITCEKDGKGIPHLIFKYKNWRLHPVPQTETELSDGTIRLIGLFWALLEGNSMLLLEEPELSLHPELVRHLPQMMAKLQNQNPQQIIVSTHSWEMLDDRGIGSDEIFLLKPSHEGTEAKSGASIKEISALMEAGFSPAEAAFPETTPANSEQLLLF